ncbi:MAG: hypothetical protein C4547_01025 [Phycisphaerales bacterium]|nr:MAG: hypothetical protein C4547_01025 [Phycisphaerales bacterium]
MKRAFLIGLIVLLLGGAAVGIWYHTPVRTAYFTDADTIRVPVAAADPRDVLWQPPSRLHVELDGDGDSYEPRLSWDGTSIYFVRGKAGENADILVSHRTPRGWTRPEPVSALNSDYDDLGPEPGADDTTIYFYSNRPGGAGGYDLWMSSRGERGWMPPVNLGPRVNSEFNDYGPAISPAGDRLYFASNRPQPQDVDVPDPDAWVATVREDLYRRTYDLYSAAITESGTGEAIALTILNTPFNEGAPAATPVGDFLYFASDRPGGEGGFDLFRARRVGGELREPANLGPAVNTPANELDPGLAMGGFALYFSSDRPPQRVDPDRPNPYALFQTASREVFPDVDERLRAAIDWAGLWATFGPHLLLALLALALLLLLLRLLSDARLRRLSLLTKCVLASLAAHVLLMFLFDFWEVRSSLAGFFGRSDSVQVALAPTGGSQRIASQIRGALTSFSAPSFESVELNRLHEAIELQATDASARLSVDRAPPVPLDRLAEIAAADARSRLVDVPPPQTRPPDESLQPVAVQVPDDVHLARAEEPPLDAGRLVTEAPLPDRAAAPRVQDAAPPVQTAMVQPGRVLSALPDPALLPDVAALPEIAPQLPSEVLPSTALASAELEETPSLDVAVPRDEAKMDRDAETPVAMNAPAPPSARVDVATGWRTVESAQPQIQQITPALEVLADLGATLASRPEDNVADADIVVAAGEALVPGAAVDMTPAETDIALSTMEEKRATATEEDAELRVAHAAPPSARSNLDADTREAPTPAVTRHDPSPAPVTPAPKLTTPDDVTLADASPAAPRMRRSVPGAEQTARIDSLQLDVEARMDEAPRPAVLSETSPAIAPAERSAARRTLSEESPAPLEPEMTAIEPQTRVADAAAPKLAELSPQPILETAVALSLPAISDRSLQLDTLERLETDVAPLEESRPAVHEEERESTLAAAQTDLARAAPLPFEPTRVVPSPPADAMSPDRLAMAIEARSLASRTDHRDVAAVPSIVQMLAPDLPTSDPSEALKLDLELPTEIADVQDPFEQRRPELREDILEQMGGSDETEEAVRLALQWLARHQSLDGHWDGELFDERCGQCGGQTNVTADIALTGLSLLAFMGSDYTHARDGEYRDVVRAGIDWLIHQQRDSGDLRGQESMYSHAIATIALAESYAMTGDPRLPVHVAKAVDFIDEARDPKGGGWRYDPGQRGDTSVTGWQVMAIKSAQIAGIEPPVTSLNAAREWMAKVSRPNRPGLYSYQPGEKPTPSMTAEGMFIQQLLGHQRSEPLMQESAAFLLDNLPDWDSQPNTYYWYYATLAMFHHGGDEWRRWNEAISRELVDHQIRTGARAGSWEPVGEWADRGGRVYQTALCTLMLEVYYRYLPFYRLEELIAPEDTVGTIRGRIVDAESGRPLVGAEVRLDLPDRPTVTARTDRQGDYVMFAPRTPDFFAVSAVKDGFVPKSANVPAAQLEGTTLTLDFALAPRSENVVAVEEEPELHHLGNNRFEGRINSQFQKRAEGSEYAGAFELSRTQTPPQIKRAEVRMLVKGVQCPTQIRINGELLEQRIDGAPQDGSFGEFRAAFDPHLLRRGANMISVRTISCRGDLDDMEFVNVQLWLERD